MENLLEMTVSKEEQEEIKEFISTLLLLPKEDRAILLSNANAFSEQEENKKYLQKGVNEKNGSQN